MIYWSFLVTDPSFDLRFSLRYLCARVRGKNQNISSEDSKLRHMELLLYDVIIPRLNFEKFIYSRLSYQIRSFKNRIPHISRMNCNRNKLLLYIIIITLLWNQVDKMKLFTQGINSRKRNPPPICRKIYATTGTHLRLNCW